MAYGVIALVMTIDLADDDSKAVPDQAPPMKLKSHAHLSPLLNPQINLLDDLEPLLDDREKELLFPANYTEDAAIKRVNGVIIGS